MRALWLLTLAAIASAAGAANAEKLTLANGDVLDGKVLERAADRVVLALA